LKIKRKSVIAIRGREHFSFCSTLEFLPFQILIGWQNAGLKIIQHGEK